MLRKISLMLLIGLIGLIGFSQISDAAPKKVKITDLKVKSGAPYEIPADGLDVGGKYYVDRDYVVVAMPDELVGIQFIMTGNGDKNGQGDDFLTFKVDLPSIIWIAHDSRGEEEKGGKPPEWLSNDYEKVMDGNDPLAIEVTDGNMGTFNLWRRSVKKGEVKIGGNADAPAAGQGSQYVVLVGVDEKGLAVEPQEKLSTTWAKIKAIR